ncbi:MAG: DUF2341 domain-containing protein, partial [Candidatus Hodarchaeota archaeon]
MRKKNHIPRKSKFLSVLFASLFLLTCITQIINSQVHNVNAAGEPPFLWRKSFSFSLKSTPAMGDLDNDGLVEIIVISSDGTIYCFNGKNGAEEWRSKPGLGIISTPTLIDTNNDKKMEIFVGSDDSNIICLNGENGVVKWRYSTGGAVESSPAVADVDNNGYFEVFAGSADSKIYCVSADNGSSIWNFTTAGAVRSSPAVGDVDNDGELEVIVYAIDNRVMCFSGSDGTSEWNYTRASSSIIPKSETLSPVIADVDGDTQLEVVAIMANANVNDSRMYCISGTGFMEWEHHPEHISPNLNDGESFFLKGPYVIDRDNNGVLDVIYLDNFKGNNGAFDTSIVKIFSATGTNGVKNQEMLLAQYSLFSWANRPYSYLSMGDIDGDNQIEYINVNGFGLVDCHSFEGGYEWNATVGSQSDYIDVIAAPIIGDVDADGDIDIVVCDYENDVTCFDCSGPSWAIRGPWPSQGGSALHGATFVDDDSEGLPNSLEINIGTDYSLSDTDGDGYDDFTEINDGNNPLDYNDAAGARLPLANFTWVPDTTFQNQQVNFSDTSLSPDSTIISWDWDFGDSSGNSTSQNPTHAYTNDGIYTVTLTVEDNNADSDTISKDIEILGGVLQPDASFTANITHILVGEDVGFSFTGFLGNYPSTFNWDFGDGTGNSTLENPTHQYSTEGTYTVTLTVNDTNGDADTVQKVDYIIVDLISISNTMVNPPSNLTGATFNISADVYANTPPIGTVLAYVTNGTINETVILSGPGFGGSFSGTWDSTGKSYGNYFIDFFADAPNGDSHFLDSSLRLSLRYPQNRLISLDIPTPESNYTIRVDLNESFNHDACLPDGGDIRFFDSSNNSLPFWIEKWNDGGHSIVWVKILQAGTTNLTIEYGSCNPTYLSNGDNTFVFFDDFSGPSIDVGKWVTSTDGYSSVTLDAGVVTITSSPVDYKGGTYAGFHNYYVSNGLLYGSNQLDVFNGNFVTRRFTNAISTPHDYNGKWGTFDMRWINDSSAQYYFNDNFITEHVNYIPSSSLPVRFLTDATVNGNGTKFGAHISSINNSLGQEGYAVRFNSRITHKFETVPSGSPPKIEIDWVFTRKTSSSDPIATLVNNNSPSLTAPIVNPSTGNTTTIFNFTVVYTDLDDDAPSFVNVLINGTPYSMNEFDPYDWDNMDGTVYKYSTYLQPGNWNYSFECGDGKYTNSTSTYSNLTVTVVNVNPPSLTNSSVNPTIGYN